MYVVTIAFSMRAAAGRDCYTVLGSLQQVSMDINLATVNPCT
jgi:hypothetical protein